MLPNGSSLLTTIQSSFQLINNVSLSKFISWVSLFKTIYNPKLNFVSQDLTPENWNKTFPVFSLEDFWKNQPCRFLENTRIQNAKRRSPTEVVEALKKKTSKLQSKVYRNQELRWMELIFPIFSLGSDKNWWNLNQYTTTGTATTATVTLLPFITMLVVYVFCQIFSHLSTIYFEIKTKHCDIETFIFYYRCDIYNNLSD